MSRVRVSSSAPLVSLPWFRDGPGGPPHPAVDGPRRWSSSERSERSVETTRRATLFPSHGFETGLTALLNQRWSRIEVSTRLDHRVVLVAGRGGSAATISKPAACVTVALAGTIGDSGTVHFPG